MRQKHMEEIFVRPKLATSNDPRLALALCQAISEVSNSMTHVSTIEARLIFLETLEKHGYSVVKGTYNPSTPQ